MFNLNKDKSFLTQTPQAFRFKELYNLAIMEKAKVSDEATLFINSDFKIKFIAGENKNNKIEDYFLIGGADGVNENISKNVDLTISLSNMTFPHMLARIVLVEQIYRSETIINNHPYHKI